MRAGVANIQCGREEARRRISFPGKNNKIYNEGHLKTYKDRPTWIHLKRGIVSTNTERSWTTVEPGA